MNVDDLLPWFLLALTWVVGIAVVGYLTITNGRLRRAGSHVRDALTYRSVDRIDEFARLTADSRFVDAGRMRHFLSEFHRAANETSQLGDTITAFSAFLVSHDVLTCWQIARIRQGQYKGFYEVPGYRLLDRLGDTETSSTYLAENMATGEVVALDLTPDKESRKILHRVARVYGNRGRAGENSGE